MKLIRQTGVELLVLGVVGLALSAVSNNIRAKGAITLGKNYFYIAEASPRDTDAGHTRANMSDEPANTGHANAGHTSTEHSSTGQANGSHPMSATNATHTPPATATKESEHPQHSFQEIDYAGVFKLLDDPDTESGLNVFVDARNDHSFEEGHIPGAVQCDHYNIDQYWDAVEPVVMGAMKVIVYCGGGDCIDSILMCQDLTDNGVPKEAIFLYAGGWKEWSEKGGPVETGRNE